MTWRWAARVLAAILLAHAMFFASLRLEMVGALLFGPGEPAGAGRLTCVGGEGACEPYLGAELWLLVLSVVVAVGLVIFSIVPRRHRA